jgi:thioredoxin-related protein
LNSALPLVLLAALAASPAAAQSPAATPAPAAKKAVSDPIPPGPGMVAWATSLEEARLRANEGDKLVFIEFTKKECGNCERMDNLLYPAADLEALLSTMVPIKVDLESAMGRDLAARYGFSEAPSVVITTPEGRLVFLMEGFYNQGEFFRHAYAGVDAYRKFAAKVESQDIARLPMKEALETGTELYRRSDSEAALPRLRRAVAAPGGTVAEREDALELLAAVEFELAQPALSRKTIERLLATTKDRERRERAELFRAQIPLAENKPAEALALFRKFQKDHPKSTRIAQVNELVL